MKALRDKLNYIDNYVYKQLKCELDNNTKKFFDGYINSETYKELTNKLERVECCIQFSQLEKQLYNQR